MTQSRVPSLAACVVVALITLGDTVGAQVGKGSIIDVNTASEKDLAALPHLTPPMVKGVLEKRPFANIVELNTYLTGQSLTPAQLSELYRKAFIHVDLNTGTRDEILLVPGAGARMVREFAEYRPWKSWAQFDKEIGKYVGAKETSRLWRYVVIQ